LQLYLRFVGRGFRIPQLVNSVQSGGAAYARLRPFLAPALSIQGEPPMASFRPAHVAGIGQLVPEPMPEETGPMTVAFQSVTFRYPGAGAPALHDVWLDIPAGTFVAVTGPVGAGKSALARALLGLFPLEAGRVLLGGRPLDTIAPAARARRIGYLPQEPFLFSGTIRDNVVLAVPEVALDVARARTVEQAVILAALADDLFAFPDRLATEIGELGIRVSGGQRQRIALARALAVAAPQSPGLLVLDDPFSAVDVDTEARIIAGLRTAFGPAAPPEQRTTIVLCSHRLAAFPQADHVIVLDGGRIVEQGTHAALIDAGGLYTRIYHAQQQVARSDPAKVPA
jgi:ATP-binding cassette, subfamily B, multidrug efflux pump